MTAAYEIAVVLEAATALAADGNTVLVVVFVVVTRYLAVAVFAVEVVDDSSLD